MYAIPLSTILRILAKGINPETGEFLSDEFSVHKKTCKKNLLKIASELERTDSFFKSHSMVSFESNNVSYLYSLWDENKTLSEIAKIHARSKLTIALKLIVSGLVLPDEVLPQLSIEDRELAERILRDKKIIN